MEMTSVFEASHKQTLAVTTLFGLEELLADELDALGAEHIKIGNRVVHCKGDLKFIYKAYTERFEQRITYDFNHLYNNIEQYFNMHKHYKVVSTRKFR